MVGKFISRTCGAHAPGQPQRREGLGNPHSEGEARSPERGADDWRGDADGWQDGADGWRGGADGSLRGSNRPHPAPHRPDLAAHCPDLAAGAPRRLDGRPSSFVSFSQEDTMTREEYEKRRRALEEQLRADIALMNAAHETRIRSLERLWQDTAEDGSGPAQPAIPAPAQKELRPRGSVINDLDAALPGLPQVFDKHDVVQPWATSRPIRLSSARSSSSRPKGPSRSKSTAPAAPPPATARPAPPDSPGSLRALPSTLLHVGVPKAWVAR